MKLLFGKLNNADVYSAKSVGSMKRGTGDGSHGKAYPRPGSAFLPESVGHLQLEGDLPPSSNQIQQMHEVVVGMRSVDTSLSASIPLDAVCSLITQPEAPILSKVRLFDSFQWLGGRRCLVGC